MNNRLQQRLLTITDRHEEIAALLSEPEVQSDQNRFRELSQEYAQLDPIKQCFSRFEAAQQSLADAEEMLQENDEEMRELAQLEFEENQQLLETLDAELQTLLLPKDPLDDHNTYLEIRAGTGGDEAALFSGDLARMYLRYADRCGWNTELVSASEGEKGGYKEVVYLIKGKEVYARLKFESGAHRVQRVPETESQGRIHTSACTVAILPQSDELEEIDIDTNDLRIDTFRASGAGGQHVNKTDSAIRITHLPSGMVVECQDERSQHKNKARALSLLQARLMDHARAEQASAVADDRRLQVGSGDRSERIRTYNFPQGRMTDHRINLTLYKLDEIIEGDLDQVIQPLRQQHQADLLASLAGED